MKFLLITYYFGNDSDVGAQRWNKNLKYIKDLAWEPVVYTFKEEKEANSSFEVISKPQFEPNKLYQSLFNKKVPSDILTNKKNSLWAKLLVFIRSNFFIPDSRVLYSIASKRSLRKRLKAKDIDLIISTGPPHSMHLLAREMSSEFKIPWIADFRDPWTGIEYFKQLPLLPFARRIHQNLERKILTSCDSLITVSESWAKHLKELGAKNINVIHNGYDTEDFSAENSNPERMSIAHFGTYPKSRNHMQLWEVFNDLVQDENFKNALDLHFYGFAYDNFQAELAPFDFKSQVKQFGSIPHHEATRKMSEYRFLFLSLSNTTLSEGRIPLKFYEYLATGRKIIAIGKKDTDLAKLMKELQCGYYINYGEEAGLKKVLKEEFLNPEERSEGQSQKRLDFSKKEQAKKYVQLFNKVSNLKNSTPL